MTEPTTEAGRRLHDLIDGSPLFVPGLHGMLAAIEAEAADVALAALRAEVEGLWALSEAATPPREDTGEWDVGFVRRVLDQYGRDPHADFAFIAAAVSFVRSYLARATEADAGEESRG